MIIHNTSIDARYDTANADVPPVPVDGCTLVNINTEDRLQRRMIELGRAVTRALPIMIGVVSLWMPLTHPTVAQRRWSVPILLLFEPVPVLVLLCGRAIIMKTAAGRLRSGGNFLVSRDCRSKNTSSD